MGNKPVSQYLQVYHIITYFVVAFIGILQEVNKGIKESAGSAVSIGVLNSIPLVSIYSFK